MRYLKGKEAEEAMKFILQAAEVAKNSTCRKSQRGVVIVKDGKIIGRGNNNTVMEELCEPPCALERPKDKRNKDKCPAYHAEEEAILDALERYNSLKGSRMYHIKVKEGEIKPSGKPSCTRCSVLVLRSGIEEFVLLHEEGLTVYDSEEFNRKSFEYHMK
ncbi:MAG: deaminase [Candidatus Aenigmatarchaeota archaeon]